MAHSSRKLIGESARRYGRCAAILIVVTIATTATSGCDQIRSYLQPPNDQMDASDSARRGTERGEDSTTIPQQAARRAISLPSVILEIEAGTLVLAPRPQTSTNSIAEGILNRTVYDVQRVSRVDGEQVFLDTPLGDEHSVNAALVLPVSTREHAQAGDRIIVPAAGRLAAGIVRDSERRKLAAIVRSQRIQMRYELKPNRYFLVDPDSVIGHFAFCDTGSRSETHLIIQEADALYVTLAAHGAVAVFETSECSVLPFENSAKIGDTVRVELLGSIREARVEGINRSDESIDVSYEWRGERRNENVSFGLFAPMEPESIESPTE